MESFLVIGAGRFGGAVAMELYEMEHEVLVVDSDEHRIDELADYVTEAIIGDGTDEAVLASLGASNFDCAVVGMASELEGSILATMMLKEMGVPYIVCKAQNELHARILMKIGADKVVHPEKEMGKRVAMSLTHRNILDFAEISDDHGVVEIPVPKKWIGKSLIESDMRKKYNVTLIAIRNKQTKDFNFTPDVHTVFHADDILTLIGDTHDLEVVCDI